MFLSFHDFYEKTYEKNYSFYVLISNLLLLYVRWQFFRLKFPTRKIAALWKCYQIIIYFHNFEQPLRKKLWKDLPFFFNIFKLPIFHYMFTKFHDQQVTKKNYAVYFNMWTKACLLHQIWTIFLINYEKPYNLWNLFLKFVSSVTLSRSFIMTSYL